MKEYAIIVAGGSGSRMGSQVPKQFLLLNGLPILFHTLQSFAGYSAAVQVIIVLPAKDIDYWNALAATHRDILGAFQKQPIVTEGGATRFQSVRNGLACIEGDGLVAIHDGVRPFVSPQIIKNSFHEAALNGSAVVAVASKDSIRLLTENGQNQALDRSKVQIVQTPQTFRVSLIKSAFLQEEKATFTDDASVAEAAGYSIKLISGSYENIKITTPEDLLLGERILAAKATEGFA